MNPPVVLGRLVAGAYAADIEPLPAPPPSRPVSKQRRKIWELEDKHHCPVIGTCVKMEELQRLAQRFGFEADTSDEFGLHVEAVQRSMTRNEVAEALQRHLERRHATAIRSFDAAKTDGAVHTLWKARLAAGDVAGPMWAALSHRAASAETRQAVHADVHMLSHQVGAGHAADTRRLAHLERESQQLRSAVERERRERVIAETVFRERMRRLETELARRAGEAAEVPRLRQRLAELESGRIKMDQERRIAKLEIANQQLHAAARRGGEFEAETRKLRAETTALERERKLLAAERDALERLLLAPQRDAQSSCPGPCPAGGAPGASERCILCVGGRTSLLSHYRALAGRLGIRLVHHDGGQEEAMSRLPDMIDGADAVICPTDCVSHAAYYQLKRHCKHSGKPCLLFKGAGISSFAIALTRFSSETLGNDAPQAIAEE